MRLRPRRQPDPAEPAPGPEAPAPPAAPETFSPGPEMLRDGDLLARWFILYELEKEMKRASRHERPLSIMVLMPVPTLGSIPPEESIERAAAAAQQAARSTDLIGWLPKSGILVVMPETDKDGAAAAVHRWRDAMYTSSMRHGAVRWRVATSINAWEYESASALIESLLGQLELASAA